MDGDSIATRTVLVAGTVLVIAGAGMAFFAGGGPAPGWVAGPSADSQSTGPSADTGSDGGTGGGRNGAGTGDGDDSTTPPYTFSVDEIETCGWKCRDVTGTLTNEQSSSASHVRIDTRIYAGNGTDGEVVWTDTERVGTLPAGESVTIRKRVKLTWAEAHTVRQNGGWITIRTRLQSDSETIASTHRRDVT